MTEKNYITQQGYRVLRDELQSLVNKERPEVVSVVSWAASNGDRSENGDYIYGKKRLREIDKRIRFLTKRLEIAEVIDTRVHVGKEQVFFGAHVVYLDEEGEEVQIQIVGVDEAEPLKGKISWISPVAKALLKKQVGDMAKVPSPSGMKTLEIIDVFYKG